MFFFRVQPFEELKRGNCKLAEKHRQAKYILRLLESSPGDWAVKCFHRSRPRIWSQNWILRTDEGRLAHNNVTSVCFANTLERFRRRSSSCRAQVTKNVSVRLARNTSGIIKVCTKLENRRHDELYTQLDIPATGITNHHRDLSRVAKLPIHTNRS